MDNQLTKPDGNVKGPCQQAKQEGATCTRLWAARLTDVVGVGAGAPVLKQFAVESSLGEVRIDLRVQHDAHDRTHLSMAVPSWQLACVCSDFFTEASLSMT
jgi:hypothetical protein